MFTKKLKTLIVVSVLSLTSLSSVNAIDLNSVNDFGEIDTAIEDTAIAEDVQISNMEVIFDDNTLPADNLSETTLFIRVNDNNEDALTEDDINVDVVILDNDENNKGEITDVTYDSDGQLFNAKYIAGSAEGDVTFKITGTSKADDTIKLSNVEDFVLTEYTAPVKEVPAETTDVESILTNLDDKEEVENTEELIEVTEGVNIVETKVIDENRLKVTFDRTIFLPDEPLSLVSIEKSADKSAIEVANITLSEDKLSLIILTKDSLGNEPYLVTITEVIDGETKKKISVVNSELTVTGLTEVVILILGLISIAALVAYRRKQS